MELISIAHHYGVFYILTCMSGEERLPASEGWHAPTSVSGLGTASVILQLAMATDEKAADLVLPPSNPNFSHFDQLVM